MESSAWTCPHCQRRHPAVTTSVVRCLDCRFVYPALRPEAEETRCQAEDEAARTVTESWAPIKSDRYQVLRVLASGVQGKILLARHRHLDQPCVIKIVGMDEDEWADVAVARLQTEARAGVRVNHGNVARVLDCDCVEGTWYFVMEYVEGLNFREMLHEIDVLDWAQVVDIGRQTALGLAAVHQVELVHRDVKPGNLMLRADGLVKIMDLGLVKIRNAPRSLAVTRAGQLLGTPYYMPPEQFEADAEVDTRADIYALGATLYHLVCGRPPFEGNGVLALAEKHRRQPLAWTGECTRVVPSWFRKLIERCLAKRLEDRFASAAALVEALQTEDGHTAPLRGPAAPASATTPHRTLQPHGIVVATFRNLSGCESDDWIGEAVAEYLTNRLMELEGVHVADRQSMLKILRREGASGETGDGSTADSAQIIEAGRLVGAHSVIVGSFQRSGDALRITMHSLSGSSEEPAPLGTLSGTVTELFDLEDRVAEKVLELVGHGMRPERARGGTASTEAHEMYMRGRRAFADGDYRKAIELAERALAFDPDYVEPLGFIGACWARLGEYDRAVEYHQRQEQTARETDDGPRLAEALANLGVMYYYKGEYPLAYEFLDNARGLSAEFNLSSDAAKHHGNLGYVLMRLNRFEDAEVAFAAAIENSQRCADLVSLIWPYNGMGSVLLKQERYAEARDYYQRALALAEEVGDRVLVGVSQMNQGRCACLLGDYAEAGRRFEAALATLQKTDFWNGLALVHEHMAEMHLQQDNLDAALACIDRRIELARRHSNNRMEAEAWEQRARAYEKRRQTDRALECLKRSLEASQRPAPYESLHRYLQEVAHRAAFR